MTKLDVYELFVDITDGKTTRRIISGDELGATLVVTDTRVIFASTSMLKAYRGTRHKTFMGHLRYEWLEGLDGANRQASLMWARPSYLRLFCRDPGDPNCMIVTTFKPLRGWAGRDMAVDVARRAAARRSQASGGDAPEFTASELQNDGMRWLADRTDAKFARMVDTLTAKGLGPLGLG